MSYLKQLTENELKAVYNDTFKCLEYLKSIKNIAANHIVRRSQKIKFHILWLGDASTFGRKQSLPVKSFLATQNLEEAELFLWSNSNLGNNFYLKEIKELVTIKTFNFINETVDTPLEKFRPLKEISSQCNTISADLARIIILYKYGGVYIDSDVILLRDFAPLLNSDFLYKWERQDWTNNAVMHLSLNCTFANLLIKEVTNFNDFSFWTLCRDVYTKVLAKCNNVVVYPCGFFDPDWLIQREKIFEIFFKNDISSNQLYDGAFAYHWHGNWSMTIEDGSKFHNYEEKIHNLLKEKFNIKIA